MQQVLQIKNGKKVELNCEKQFSSLLSIEVAYVVYKFCLPRARCNTVVSYHKNK